MRVKLWAFVALVAVAGCGPSNPPAQSADPDAASAREREQDAASQREGTKTGAGEQPDLNPANP